jgi:hypothetical protein
MLLPLFKIIERLVNEIVFLMGIKKLLFIVFVFSFLMGRAGNVDSLETWKLGALGNLTFSRVSLTNWAAGGQNTVSANTLFSLYLNYKKNKTSWKNSLDLAYGIVKQGDKGESEVIKSDDKIDFSSKAGRQIFNNKWYLSALMNVKTQFYTGYNYPNDSVKISDYMSPAYLILSVGMDYMPTDNFSLLLSPLTGKSTIVNSPSLSSAGAFGVAPGSKAKHELGGFMKAVYRNEFKEDIIIDTKLDLFSNYIEKPGNIDVSWEVLINLKVTKILSVNINTHLLYDDDIEFRDEKGWDKSRIQFKEIYGVGLSYNL